MDIFPTVVEFFFYMFKYDILKYLSVKYYCNFIE